MNNQERDLKKSNQLPLITMPSFKTCLFLSSYYITTVLAFGQLGDRIRLHRPSLNTNSYDVKQGTVYFMEGSQSYSYVDDGSDKVINGEPAVRVYYQDSTNSTGWAFLEIDSIAGLPDINQAYAAGYAEGTLTWERIYQHNANIMHNDLKGQKPSSTLSNWMIKQMSWIREQTLRAKEHTLPKLLQYWGRMELLLAQFDGLVKGYNDHATEDRKLTALDLWMLNSAGDLETLIPLLQNTTAAVKESDPAMMDCSALIKVVLDRSGIDVLSGHATWRSYTALLRTYKFYTFNYADNPTSVSFASSPGFLSSKDDFYITDKGLVTMETTNNVYDNDLWQFVAPQSVLTWQRSILANQLAHSGAQWVDIFSFYNSGTYNNQWMVVDYNKVWQYRPGSDLSGLLWILEQIPGVVEVDDVTDVLLKQGYWASYNVPYFDKVYELSGYPDTLAKGGSEQSYSNCSRARIFRREAPQVQSLNDMRQLLRLNQYKHDPEADHQPDRAIAARLDLRTDKPQPFGAIDSKVTDSRLARQLACHAVSGPTNTNGLSPFSWSKYEETNPNQTNAH